MRAIPVMIAIASLIIVAVASVHGLVDEPVVSTGLFNLPMQRIAQLRQPATPIPETDSAAPVSERPFQRAAIRDNIALVTELNTRWDESRLSLITSFDAKTTHPESATIAGSSPAEIAVQKWIDEGTAAGHNGILYDNRDRDHSNLNRRKFPHLAFVEYDAAAKKSQADWGLRIGQAFDLPTFGNSSTSHVGSPFWRSNPRAVLIEDLLTKIVYNEFVNNQMYCYPEHNDFDPEHGDVYPANTPFWVISQGSSGSDQQFMEAIALTLAAFRPDVRAKLIESHWLMSVVQMLLRRSQKSVQTDDDYFTGKAHPVVFQPSELDTLRMVQLARDMTIDKLPAMARIQVIEEDLGVPGRDYFHPHAAEKLFDTPAAIARVFRTTAFTRRMIVDASTSAELSGRSLRFRWSVLQGDPEKVQIRLLDAKGTRAEIIFQWHPRTAIRGLSGMETNRVDIGVFADNGQTLSLPAFVSSFTLANEGRTYIDGRIQTIDYGSPGISDRYVDPMIDIPKRWRDEYRYSADIKPRGWVRTMPDAEPQEFAADGRLVVKKDDAGNPTEFRTIKYEAELNEKHVPVLKAIVDP